MASRRERQQRRLKRQKEAAEKRPAQQPVAASHEQHRRPKGFWHTLYHDHYRLLLIIPLALLFLAILQIGVQTAQTGDFLHKGVSLKGGITLTVPVQNETVTPDQVEAILAGAYPANDIVVRGVSEFGILKGLTIEASVGSGDANETKALEKGIIAQVTTLLPDAGEGYSVEVIGPSLGTAFFQQTFKAVIIAFLLMGMVIFLYFGDNLRAKIVSSTLSIIAALIVFKVSGTVAALIAGLIAAALIWLYIKYSVPSAAVILAAISDILVTVAIVNLLGVKISSAGIAAFLMLIGYSVDTDILLSTRVLKQQKGTVYERVISSMKTGMTMSLTSMAAALVGYLVSQSDTIQQIMLIILIGLATDIIMTWIQNAAIIRMYAEKKEL